MMHVCALSMELHLPASRSLKAKRVVVKHIVEVCRSRFGVAAAEVGHQDQWQRSELGFAAVADSPSHVEAVSMPSSDSCGPIPSWRYSLPDDAGSSQTDDRTGLHAEAD